MQIRKVVLLLSLILVSLPILFLALFQIYLYTGGITIFACRGENKRFDHGSLLFERGAKHEGSCVTLFKDGGRPCQSGKECSSGICYLPKIQPPNNTTNKGGAICKGDNVQCKAPGSITIIGENGVTTVIFCD